MRDLHSDEPFADEPPETMYKYTSSTRALEILMNKQIYFAKSSEFNDPFDGQVTFDIDTPEKRTIFIGNLERKYGISIPIKEKQEFINNSSGADKLARAIVNKWQKANSTGYCCLTDTGQSLPMWAHYADNHTGCCLMFDFSKHSNLKSPKDDFPFYWMKKIEYQKDLPKYNMGGMCDYIHKSSEWEYENEWRAIMFDKNMSFHPNADFYKECRGAGLYPLGNFLCGVILGYRIKKAAEKKIINAARQRDISVQQASPELYEYGIRLTEINNRRFNRHNSIG